MKKSLLLLLAVVFSAAAAHAQDIIVKRDGEELQTKVVEIGDNQIKYRKFSNPTGPVYSIASSEVFLIRYENGTKEVVTSEQTIPANQPADDKYAHVKQAVAKAKAPLHDKSVLWGVRADFGYAWINSTVVEAPAGLMYGVAAVLDWFPNKYSSSGLGLKVGMGGYILSDSSSDDKLNRYDLNLDLCWTVRSRALGLKLGPRIGIPVSSKVGDIDAMSLSKVTCGLSGEVTWSPRHFDLGVGYVYSFTNAFDLGSDVTSTLNGIYLTIGYRF